MEFTLFVVASSLLSISRPLVCSFLKYVFFRIPNNYFNARVTRKELLKRAAVEKCFFNGEIDCYQTNQISYKLILHQPFFC